MVLRIVNNFVRVFIRISFLITLIFCFSCEKQGLFVKCSECTEEEPLKADLEIKLDWSNNGAPTTIDVYEGNLEDNVLYTTSQVSGTSATISVTLNKQYTVTAVYIKTGKTYTAVDSAKPRVAYNKDQCDKPCYYIYDRTVDLRLKYTK